MGKTNKNNMDKTNKNPIFSIKNFRSFGEDGADFELAPITVLTGCNSAGKSSLVKALMLLSEMPHTINHIEEPSLNLYKREFGLGSFKNVLNKGSKDRKIEIMYKVWSTYLQQWITVQRTFSGYKGDELNDAHQNNLVIYKNDGQIIFNQKDSDIDWCNELEWAKRVDKEFGAFLLTSEYLRLLRVIIIGKDKDRGSSLHNRYEECIQKITSVREDIKKNNIYYKDYSINQLELWRSWINHRKEEMDDWLKDAKDESEKNEIINTHFPEWEIHREYLSRTVNEATSPWFLENTIYIDSTSAIIKRIYSIEDTSKMSIALRNLYFRIRFQEEHSDWLASDGHYWCGSFLNNWIKEFNIVHP